VTIAALPLARIPFAPADADALAAFCVAHGCPFDAAMVRRLIVDLTSDPAGVFVLGDASGPAVVATVVDRAENEADAASVEILGVRVPVPAAELVRLLVEPAIAFARAGSRRALHFVLEAAHAPRLDGAEDVLGAAGFTPAYDSFTMRRGPDAPALAPQPPLPAGWGWGALDDDNAEAVHGLLADAFRGIPGFSLSPLPVFKRAPRGSSIFRVLLDGARVAGIVNVAPGGAAGALRTVARAPAYRARGLGPRLVAEGLRLLEAAGARTIALDVAARNERALSLYRRFGFEIASRTPVFGLALR
jgi:ribosomal protein S18 acetylase RimI-like enzyme